MCITKRLRPLIPLGEDFHEGEQADLSSSTIAEALQFGRPPLCRIYQAGTSMRSPQGSRFHSDGGEPQLTQAVGNGGSVSG